MDTATSVTRPKPSPAVLYRPMMQVSLAFTFLRFSLLIYRGVCI